MSVSTGNMAESNLLSMTLVEFHKEPVCRSLANFTKFTVANFLSYQVKNDVLDKNKNFVKLKNSCLTRSDKQVRLVPIGIN